MSAISVLNPKAEVARAAQALAVNISAAKGIQDVLKRTETFCFTRCRFSTLPLLSSPELPPLRLVL